MLRSRLEIEKNLEKYLIRMAPPPNGKDWRACIKTHWPPDLQTFAQHQHYKKHQFPDYLGKIAKFYATYSILFSIIFWAYLGDRNIN